VVALEVITDDLMFCTEPGILWRRCLSSVLFFSLPVFILFQ